MKKKLIVSLAVIASLNITGTVFAATGTLNDVPAKHWAYGAVSQLVKDGIIDGYGDGTFRGDRTITRYEFAIAISKAIDNYKKADAKDQSEILKLVSEFSSELNNIGARLGAVEKKTGSVKFSGDSRLRLYQKNYDLANTNRIQERVRLTGDAIIDDNWSFSGRFGDQFTSNRTGLNSNKIIDGSIPTVNYDRNKSAVTTGSTSGETFFDRAEFKYKNNNLTGTIGRSTLFLGQGLLYDFFYDGVSASYVKGKLTSKILLGDASATREAWNQNGTGTNGAVTWVGAENFWATDFKYTASKNFALTANTYFATTNGYGPIANSKFKDVAVGANTTFGNFNLLGEYVKNTTSGLAQPSGYWANLRYKVADVTKPGSWSVNARYVKLGKDAIDTTPTTLNYASAAGTKGYEAGVDYVFAKNAHLNVFGGKYKSYDSSTTYNTAYSAVAFFNF